MILLLMMLSMFEPMASAIHTPHQPPGTSGPDAHLALSACDSNIQVQCSSDGGKTYGPWFHPPCNTKLASLCP